MLFDDVDVVCCLMFLVWFNGWGCFLLFVVRYVWFVCRLFIVCWLMLFVRCLLFVDCCLLFVVSCFLMC